LERKRKTIELAKKATGNGNGSKKSYLRASELRKFQDKQDEDDRRKRRRRANDEFAARKHGLDRDGDGDRDRDDLVKKGLDSEDSLKSIRNKGRSNGGGGDMNTRRSDTNEAKADQNLIKSDESSSAAKHVQEIEKKKSSNKMSSKEITDALRNFGIPVWIFGEKDDSQRMERLNEARDTRKAAMAGLSEIDDFKLGSGHGIRNPFLGGKNKNDDENNMNIAMDNKKMATKKGKSTEENAVAHNSSAKKDEDGDNLDEGDDDDDPHKSIHRFFKYQLKRWEEDLVNRVEIEKRSLSGKNETKTLKQCKDYIRPLFKLCKNRRLEEGLTAHLLKIVKFCKEGEFVKANDSYLDVAIGRAAWPIGVTMVGIHARSGRAKIESSNVAHVMNSELQRKYLTSVKRLITYCQKKRVDVAPSKKVNNC